MRIIFLFVSAACAITLTSCSNEKSVNTEIKKKTALSYALNPINIYKIDSIELAIKNANVLQKTESRRLFMTGLDLLANKNDATASIEYFKEAIYYYPDEKNYTHLFKAYLSTNDLALADSVNNALDGRIDYSELSFNQALIYAARKDTVACIEQLNTAIAQGFAFNDRITNEKLFDFLKENLSFQSLLVTNFGDDEKIRKTLFTAFLKSIPKLNLPFEIKSDSAYKFNFDNYINYDFALFIPGMKNSRFSRDVSNEYMYVGTFKTESGLALIYKSYQVMADTLNPVSINLLVYDSLGKVISDKEIGCFCSPLQSKGFTIFEDLSLDVKTYKINWEFSPLENGYAKNKVVSKEEVGYNTYKITRDNLIKDIEAPKQETALEN